jgi:excisionase family DNA binding protein
MTEERLTDLITAKEAAQLTGRHVKTVRRWIRTGLLPAKKLGRAYMIDPKDLWADYTPTERKGGIECVS